ncbi:MAG: chromosome segregation SMC family protein, partial [Sphingomonas sp.]
MKVKRLKLSGFKSFVEAAELAVEPGLTGVVGPNGCGKSNVLEAIRWVMGESSPKSMRGAGMDDVIFAGTALRPARDFAEVSMLVERETGDIGGDSAIAPVGEMEITRRIERGAGSAYRINGRDVRQKDVALLFADAATGAHSPALVSQGKIAAVIAAKPTERRLLLEEAAGVAGLHVRRKDAEQKLRAAEANLVRLDEMLADSEQRAAALRRQARAAERYRKLSDQIRVAEARLLFGRWREAAEAAEAARAEAEAAERSVDRAAEAQRGAAAHQAEAAASLAEARKAAEQAREQASEIGHRLAALRAERDTVQQRIVDLETRRETLAADLTREAALGEDAAAARERLTAEIAAIGTRLEQATARRGAIDVRSVEAESAALAAENALGQARAIEAAEQAQARVAAAALDAARQKHERAEVEAKRIAAQLAELDDAATAEDALVAARERLEAARTRQEMAARAIVGAEAERQRAATAREAAESEVAVARAALAALQAEARALTDALDRQGGDRAINHVTAAAGYERALAAALGEDLDASLAGDGPRRWAGTAALAGDPSLPPGCQCLADHVDAPPPLHRRLRQIGVVDSDDGTIPLAVGQRLVTLDGQLRRWDGYVARGVGAAAAERLVRVNRLAAIEQSLPEAEAKLATAQRQGDAAREAAEAARIAGEAARRAETEAADATREAQRAEDQAGVEIERLTLRRQGLAERAGQLEADRSDAAKAVAAAETAMAALPAAERTAANVAALRETAEAAQHALAEIRAEAATHARAVAADRERAETASAEQVDWAERAQRAADRHAEVSRRIEAAAREAESLAAAPERLASEIAALAAEAEAAAGAADAAAARERAGEDRLREIEVALADVAEALSSARETRAGAAARAEAQDARRIEMARIAGEKFECSPPLLPETVGFPQESIAEVAAESARLERQTQERERIGPVNLVAESELAELEEDRVASQAEREELGQAINRLRGSIGSLNREGRVRLLTAFQEVDQHFRSLFTTLFEGGQAHLELIESDDPLEAGLEILAQP